MAEQDVFWQAIRDGYSYEQAELKQLRAERARREREEADRG